MNFYYLVRGEGFGDGAGLVELALTNTF